MATKMRNQNYDSFVGVGVGVGVGVVDPFSRGSRNVEC